MNKFFSVKTIKESNKFSKKIITILGIKITFSSPKIEDVIELFNSSFKAKIEDVIELNNSSFKANIVNKNLLFFIFEFIKRASKDELFCLRNSIVCFIFNKNVTNWQFGDFSEFIMNNVGSDRHLLVFEKLAKNTILYQEHIKRHFNNEFLWKYLNRGNLIRHTYLSYDDKNTVYINEVILDSSFEKTSDCNSYFKVENSTRLYIPGRSVKEYLKNKTPEEKKQILINLINYIFKTYSVNNGMIDGIMLDCNCANFVIDINNNFHFIDKDYVSKEPVSKEYIIGYVLKDTSDKILKENIYKYFGYQCERNEDLMKENKQYAKLKNKYFIQE